MPSTQSFTLKMPLTEEPALKSFFLQNGFSFEALAYAFWRAKQPGCVAAFYKSGKLLLQGSEADAWRRRLSETNDAAKPYEAALKKHPSPEPQIWIGTDEAGKGDYFGPLVVAGFVLERSKVPLLAELAVGDSKTLADSRMRDMDEALKAIGRSEVLVIGPKRYNELHAQMGNVNRLLAWAHAKVIENLLAQGPADYVLTDQFTSLETITRAFGPLAKAARFEARTKAEEDPAVAAASVLARSAYMRSLAAMAKQYGEYFKPGAGADVIALGRRLVQSHGPHVLNDIAKAHFATTTTITGQPALF